MASKLATSASGLARGLLGIDAAPESIPGALASSGPAGKSQPLPSASASSFSIRAEGSGSSCAANIRSTRHKPPLRTETQQEQASELEFASFLESQPTQTFESPPAIIKPYQPSETATHGLSESAQRAPDILVAGDMNPSLHTALPLQSSQLQDASEQRQSIRSHVQSGDATWEPEVASESNTGAEYRQQNLQATTQRNSQQSESELAQGARNMLIINGINPDLLTESQLLSFQRGDSHKQRLLIRAFSEDLNGGIRSNGLARQAVNVAHPGHTRQGQLDDLNHPPQNTSRAQQAIELLVANGINPEQLTASQFNSFQQQSLNVQQKSVEVYLINLAQHERSIRQQEQQRQHMSQNGEDGAAVVALLSQPNFLDIIDTSQDDDDLPPIWSLELTSSQIDTIERLKALLPTPPTHNPSSPTQALNLFPTEALSIPSPWDSEDANLSYAEQARRRHQWLRDWDGVLRRYADEVWGDLLPLVEEAREEIKEASENDGEVQGEGRAVRRLAMILGHLIDNKIAQNG
ncbi:hypothetical protein GP486_001340 [Trichoglossum hirsutum]|uniref:Uncharacterized protein n=1 Tax=Trichoglossum hirsutum TaxID=265104 RepID=A0A9P8RSQ9_9PEZI|nr:hypothetical protein GP486_001340 [Trichoglossum hirsutum]